VAVAEVVEVVVPLEADVVLVKVVVAFAADVVLVVALEAAVVDDKKLVVVALAAPVVVESTLVVVLLDALVVVAVLEAEVVVVLPLMNLAKNWNSVWSALQPLGPAVSTAKSSARQKILSYRLSFLESSINQRLVPGAPTLANRTASSVDSTGLVPTMRPLVTSWPSSLLTKVAAEPSAPNTAFWSSSKLRKSSAVTARLCLLRGTSAKACRVWPAAITDAVVAAVVVVEVLDAVVVPLLDEVVLVETLAALVVDVRVALVVVVFKALVVLVIVLLVPLAELVVENEWLLVVELETLVVEAWLVVVALAALVVLMLEVVEDATDVLDVLVPLWGGAG
jgi:hypothetical protein